MTQLITQHLADLDARPKAAASSKIGLISKCFQNLIGQDLKTHISKMTRNEGIRHRKKPFQLMQINHARKQKDE